MSYPLVRRRHFPVSAITTYGNRALWGSPVEARNIFRRLIRRRKQIQNGVSRAKQLAKKSRDKIHRKNRRMSNGPRKFYRMRGSAAGITHTTTRMIVRKTPRSQRFMRKMFKNNPIKSKYVNRFGFAWMGAAAASKTIWYSVCHLKFNNVVKYMKGRITNTTQGVGTSTTPVVNAAMLGNNPDSFIYIGKCTFSYELYNPTNYIMTVFIYDLICKRDTPHGISYSDAEADDNSAPEACMQKGSKSMNNTGWAVADPTLEQSTFFNTIGMKPTDYHLFNTLWKVKGMKKIVLPPTSSHHHVVVFNPKKKITNASLFYPRETLKYDDKIGLGGLTQATLFGFQGQVACENDQAEDNTNSIGTLPGKLLVNVVKKINVWNIPYINFLNHIY